MRIGQGFDVHRLEEGHKVILCGIEIPHEKGLVGWSDADCAVHALMDALLGACGLPDIGHLFPPGDERYRGVSSLTLLEYVMRRVNAGGYRICNCDITIMAERPTPVKICGPCSIMICLAFGNTLLQSVGTRL